MRTEPSVLHVDLDAFFAAVEQRDKPSLRGKPVVVGGTGPRGVVSTASYEARRFGIGSAMSMNEARARCRTAAFLAPRFAAYKSASDIVMAVLRELSAAVEPLSMDEAFLDLALPDVTLSTADVYEVGTQLRARIAARTGLTASVGAATSKLVAKIASDLDKPDGLRVVPPGAEQDLIDPMPVSRLWGAGPATSSRLARLGVRSVADLRRLSEAELVGLFGQAHGTGLWRLARARDDRPVLVAQESKSVSVEDTFAVDVVERARLVAMLDAMATRVAGRLVRDGLSGRTVTVKVRQHDFVTLSRSATLRGPTDDGRTIARLARRLLDEVDTSDGVRLLGVGVSGLTTWAQEDLFAEATEDEPEPYGGDAADGPDDPDDATVASVRTPAWAPGQDVWHRRIGAGWVQGSGAGRVTVRFETRESPPGRVQTFGVGDPELTAGG